MDLPRSIITLTTDFGTRDYFSGAMKGVILGIAPDARLVDISHDVPSHDVWGAAYLIGAAYRFFPARSIHLVVVDPGVGSQRRPILAVTDRHYFVAPDNGVLSFIYRDPGLSRVIHITSEHYFLPSEGSTFQARDIFAPAAAWLLKGVEADKFGEEITDYARFNIPAPRKEGEGVLAGEVVYTDKFGNSITNISMSDLRGLAGPSGGDSFKIAVGEMVIEGLSPFYASVKRGGTGVVVNGNGFLEVFVNQGDARRAMGIKRGDGVRIIFG